LWCGQGAGLGGGDAHGKRWEKVLHPNRSWSAGRNKYGPTRGPRGLMKMVPKKDRAQPTPFDGFVWGKGTDGYLSGGQLEKPNPKPCTLTPSFVHPPAGTAAVAGLGTTGGQTTFDLGGSSGAQWVFAQVVIHRKKKLFNQNKGGRKKKKKNRCFFWVIRVGTTGKSI